MADQTIKIWGAQIRGSFLVLSVLLAGIGLALAGESILRSGVSFNGLKAALVAIGVVLSHASVNLFNEYSDWKTGIDSSTERTPFSGGSGMMQEGLTKPGHVLAAALGTLVAAMAIGIYFIVVSHWILIPIILVGGLSILFYTPFLAKILLGEIFAGLSLGSLVVIGAYIAMTADPSMAPADIITLKSVLVSIPPGILTFLLLFLNEFPDMEADRKGGRFHLVIFLGKKKASILYIMGLVLVYLSIIIIPILGVSSWWVLVALLTVPVAARAGKAAFTHRDDTKNLVPAMGMNVIIVLATDALLAVAFLIVIFS